MTNLKLALTLLSKILEALLRVIDVGIYLVEMTYQ